MPLCWGSSMESRTRKGLFTVNSRAKPRGIRAQEAGNRGGFPSKYFSAENFLVLLCLTASMLILPVILPALPPPPLAVLLLPIGILALLLVLALMPSDVRKIASPCE